MPKEKGRETKGFNYTTINHNARKKLLLSLAEYCVADMIYNLSSSPKAKKLGWCNAPKSFFAEALDLQRSTIHNILNRLLQDGLVEHNPDGSNTIRTTEGWYDRVLIRQDENCPKSGQSDAPQTVQKVDTNCPKSGHETVQKVDTPIIDKDINKDNKGTAPAPSGAAPDPRIKPLQTAYWKQLKHKLGEAPARYNGGAAGRGFKNLLHGEYTLREILVRMKRWFKSTDPFLVKRSYCVEDFISNFNGLKDGPIHKQGGSNAGIKPQQSDKYAQALRA